MRDDFDGDLPDIRATDEDRVGARPAEQREAAPEPPLVRAVREPAPRRQRNGALWAVCLSLLIALIGLGYWSHQQQTRLQQQLVATQKSFAQISEEAAGRLQDISGKVVATESTLSEGEQARTRQLSQLEDRVDQLAAALQTQEQQSTQDRQQLLQQLQQASETQTERLAALDGLTANLGEEQQRQQQGLAELQQQAERAEEARVALQDELTQADEQLQLLATLEQQLAEQDSQLARQRGELQALLETSSGPSDEQELLVLRSEVEQRLASIDDALRAIDSFRVQANRNISTLQSQLSNLQQQMSQR